jgi:hypothetical protein
VDPEGRFARIVPDPARRSSQTTSLETSSILRRVDQQLFCKTIIEIEKLFSLKKSKQYIKTFREKKMNTLQLVSTLNVMHFI